MRYFVLILATQIFFQLNLFILNNIYVIRYNLSLRGIIIHLKIVDFYQNFKSIGSDNRKHTKKTLKFEEFLNRWMQTR